MAITSHVIWDPLQKSGNETKPEAPLRDATAQAAEFLGINERNLRKACRLGRVPGAELLRVLAGPSNRRAATGRRCHTMSCSRAKVPGDLREAFPGNVQRRDRPLGQGR